MRILGSAVLVMEFFVMGFAMLLAKDNHEPSTIIAGAIIAILMLLTPGLLKKRTGWILGSILQTPVSYTHLTLPTKRIV